MNWEQNACYSLFSASLNRTWLPEFWLQLVWTLSRVYTFSQARQVSRTYGQQTLSARQTCARFTDDYCWASSTHHWPARAVKSGWLCILRLKFSNIDHFSFHNLFTFYQNLLMLLEKETSWQYIHWLHCIADLELNQGRVLTMGHQNCISNFILKHIGPREGSGPP